MTSSALLAASAALALATGLKAQTLPTQTPPAAATPAADSWTATTPRGTSFTTSPRWTKRALPQGVELTAPEGDLRIAVIDVATATDAADAATKAWAAWGTGQARAPWMVTPRVADNGWDERRFVDYQVSPDEKRVLNASPARAGTGWTVILRDGAVATYEKRAAAVVLVGQSMRAPGYQPESFAGRTPHAMDATRIAALRAFVEDGMRQLGIPGAALAITDTRATLWSGGFGVRELGQPAPVDGDTSFAIASNTKGMATLLLARLVDEGKLRWDQPVTDVFPAFRLGSDATTARVLVRHLVCACTGLPRKDFQVLFNASPDTGAKDTFAQLAATQPTSGFGEVFQYNNLMASAAGYIGAHIVEPGATDLDAAFARAMQAKVWGPLGMTRTTLDFAAGTRGNWARPHGIDIANRPVAMIADGARLNAAFTRYGAAGGAWSTASDMAKYVRLELNQGRMDDGRPLLSPAAILERRAPNVPVGDRMSYGMGLQLDQRSGVDVVHHGGSLFGYKTDWFAVPAAGVGVVLLTNHENGGFLHDAVERRLLELLYDGKPEAAAKVAAGADRLRTETQKEAARMAPAPDAAVVARLAPRYRNADLGLVEVVRREGGGVALAFRTITAPVTTRLNEDKSTSLVINAGPLLFVDVLVGEKAGKRTLTLRDAQHEFVFVEA